MSAQKQFLSFVIVLTLFFGVTASGQMRQVHVEPGSIYGREIQKISFYSPSHGFIASEDDTYPWVGFTADSGRTISKRYITLTNVDYGVYLPFVNLTFGFGIQGVKAFNQDTIVVYGDYGLVPAILYSTNGGVSFALVFHSQFYANQLSGGITDMVFPENNNIGYAIDADRILKTTNKGLSWFVVRSDPNSYFHSLEAVDNNNVVTFSTDYNASKLLKTSNGGSSWQLLSLPAPTIYYCTFLTANKGWLNARDSKDSMRLYYTSNGGSTWIQKNDPLASPFSCQKMKFVNDSTGYAMCWLFTTYKTTDSGKVWQQLPRDNNFSYLYYSHNDMQCLSENQLWCGGAEGFLEMSTNGGGEPLPRALFKIDTANSLATGVVKLLNYSKPAYQFKWYVNNALTSTSYNATYTHNLFSPVDSVVLIVTSGSRSDTLKRYQYFIVPNLPTVTSFSPTSGSTGTFVTIDGSHFTGVTSVTFGGTAASSFTIVSDSRITATVGSGATGSIRVSNTFGGYSLPTFTYFAPPSSAAPVVTSFSPASGPIGTVVTIAGNNFGTSAQDNVVYFGAVKAAVMSATSTQIICKVPAGATFEPFSIVNKTTNLTGQSFKPFAVTFADSSNFTSHSFINTFNIDLGPYVYSKHVVAKDLDGDGKPDLAVTIDAAGAPDSVVVYRNNSVGSTISFGARQNIASASVYSLGFFELNDIDGDDKPDLVTSTNTSDVSVFRNTSVPGTISFDARLNVPTQSSGNQQVIITDLDNDGKNDVAVAGFSTANIAVVKNTSAPGFVSFAKALTYRTTDNPYSIAAGDLDGDGKKDLVCFNYVGTSGSSFSCFQNTSAGGSMSFVRVFEIAVSGDAVSASSITIADYDNDGKLDVIIFNDANCCIFRNISSGNTIAFADAINIPLLWTGHHSIVSNLSGDAKPDIVAGNTSYKRVFRLARNRSLPGSIANDRIVENEPEISFPYYVNTGDFDLDGKLDIVTSSAADGIVSIFRNRMGEPVPFSDFNLCAGRYLERQSDVTGTTYQWQQDTGSGFVNLTDDAVFSGTQTSKLMIASAPLSWNGYLYRCIVDSELYSSSFKLKLNTSSPPSVSISTPVTTICAGTPVTFTATGVNTSDLTSYSWVVNGINVGNNLSTYTTSTLTNGSQVKANLFNPCANPNLAVSNVITMTVNGAMPSVSISTPTTVICVGTAISFTATAVNAGVSPSYQWQVNGVNVGTNSTTFSSSTLNNNDQVRLILTTAATACGTNPPVTSNILTITVNNPTVPSVTISTNSTTVCQGNSVAFAATPVNGGANPAYQWQVNSVSVGSNTQYFSTTTLTNGSQVSVKMTSNSNCVTTPTANSNVITMEVDSIVAPRIVISGNTTVTVGQSTVISAAITNGGTAPSYQWQDSTSLHSWQTVSVGSPASWNYTPARTGDKIKCVLTALGICISPATVTSDALSFVVTAVTGISPVTAADYNIRYFPNPANKILFIDSLKLTDKWRTLEVLSIDGRTQIAPFKIFNRTSVTLDISRLPSGEFLGILRRDDGSIALLKFIKL